MKGEPFTCCKLDCDFVALAQNCINKLGLSHTDESMALCKLWLPGKTSLTGEGFWLLLIEISCKEGAASRVKVVL